MCLFICPFSICICSWGRLYRRLFCVYFYPSFVSCVDIEESFTFKWMKVGGNRDLCRQMGGFIGAPIRESAFCGLAVDLFNTRSMKGNFLYILSKYTRFSYAYTITSIFLFVKVIFPLERCELYLGHSLSAPAWIFFSAFPRSHLL
jgi:hypothetical protein